MQRRLVEAGAWIVAHFDALPGELAKTQRAAKNSSRQEYRCGKKFAP